MRRHFFTWVFVATTFGFSIENSAAQDILSRPRPGQPLAANWTGPYFGGNIGYGWSKLSGSYIVGGSASSDSASLDGVVGGVQVGGNYQVGMWVLGAEADFQGTDQKKSVTLLAGGTTISATGKLPWFGTARLRAGVTVDRALIYATGGVAYGEFRVDGTLSGANTGSFSYSTTRAAWTAGGGLESKITNNLSWKIEYLHIDTGTISNSATVNGTLVTSSAKFVDEVVRFGLNYTFR